MLKNNLITKSPNERLYKIPVPIIGLTGGIATGKSTVSKILRERNFNIIDADSLVKKIYQNSEVIDFIKENFNQAIINDEINFKILRQIAFNSPENIQKIENKIYQYLPSQFLNEFQLFQNPDFIVYDVPLLFEKGLDKLVDLKVCVYTTREVQLNRLISRDKIEVQQAEKILQRQMDIDEKAKNSDFLIDNSSDFFHLEKNVSEFINKILK